MMQYEEMLATKSKSLSQINSSTNLTSHLSQPPLPLPLPTSASLPDETNMEMMKQLNNTTMHDEETLVIKTKNKIYLN